MHSWKERRLDFLDRNRNFARNVGLITNPLFDWRTFRFKLRFIMRTPKTSPRKENSSDNFCREKQFQKNQYRSPQKPFNNSSKIPIPKIPTSKLDQSQHSIDESEEIEKEIEAKLRLRLHHEYAQKYHELQEKHDRDIFKSSEMIETSFINNFNILNSYPEINVSRTRNVISDEYEYEQEYEYEYEYDEHDYNQKYESKQSSLKAIAKLENEISKQRQYHEEVEKKLCSNTETLNHLESQFAQSEIVINSEKKEQQKLSSQINELYTRYSNLMLELNARKERRHLEMIYNNSPDSYNGEINKVDFGLSIGDDAMGNELSVSHHSDISADNDESDTILFESKPNAQASLKHDLTPPILLDQNSYSETSRSANNLMLIDSECITTNSDGRNEINTVKMEPINSLPDSSFATVMISESSVNLNSQFISKTASESTLDEVNCPPDLHVLPEQSAKQNTIPEQSDELPNELFRAPYRIKIPIRPPKK